MGAYGAALIAKEEMMKTAKTPTSLVLIISTMTLEPEA